MTQIEKNKTDLWEDIQKLTNEPINASRASQLVSLMQIYDALCRVACARDTAAAVPVKMKDKDTSDFNRQMAEEWVSQMRNSDGTRGPHFSTEKAKEIMKQYNVDCDPLEFWLVINSLYSDYDQALKKNNASTLELYACLAKAWIEDQDAVPNKLAAYYTYVVEH